MLDALQKQNGVRMPHSDEEWATFPRTHILVDRAVFLDDALREAKQDRFDPTKALNVRTVFVAYMVVM